MVKIYLRYGLKKTIGVIASAPANVVFDPTGKCALTGALEQVVMWNVRRGAEVSTFVPSLESKKKQPLVSRLCMSPDKRTLAVGFVAPLFSSSSPNLVVNVPLENSDQFFPTFPFTLNTI
jgi:U3 small nucleolar RNA-associated protein 12